VSAGSTAADGKRTGPLEDSGEGEGSTRWQLAPSGAILVDRAAGRSPMAVGTLRSSRSPSGNYKEAITALAISHRGESGGDRLLDKSGEALGPQATGRKVRSSRETTGCG